MTFQELKRQMAVVKLSNVLLETLDKVADDVLGGIPSGHAYMVLSSMLNLDQFQGLLNGLTKVKAIKVKHDFITKGEDFDKVFSAYGNLEKKWKEQLNVVEA